MITRYSTFRLTLQLANEPEGTTSDIGFVTDPHREYPLFHAKGPTDNWSRCSLANIAHCQPMPVGHLMWFARPCKKCWTYSRTVDSDTPLWGVEGDDD